MEYGLVLEGGGAKGAYQIGVLKALKENKFKFNTVVGTSIGAINAAMVVQNRLDDAIKLWSECSYEKMFGIDDKKVDNALSAKIDMEIIKYFSSKFGKALKNGGISTNNIRNIITSNVDEKKVRKSKMRFGLVTICLSDRKANELFIEDIPEGELVDYLMATSSLPVFKRAKIDNKKYLDGGSYDNCPVEMLYNSGVKNIIAIRNYKRMRIRNYKEIIKKDDINLQMIEPVDNLPGILKFDSKSTNEMITLGYYDGLKFAKKLDGIRYYINPENENEFLEALVKYNVNHLKDVADNLNVEYEIGDNLKKIFFEKMLNMLVANTLKKEASSYKESIYALVEHIAKEEKIEKYKIYDFKELLDLVKQSIDLENCKKENEAIYRFIKYFEF